MASRRERRRRREARDAGRRKALLVNAVSWMPEEPPLLPITPSYLAGDSDMPLFSSLVAELGGLPPSPPGTVWGASMYEAVVDELDQLAPWQRAVIDGMFPPSDVPGVAALIAAITEPTALMEAVNG